MAKKRDYSEWSKTQLIKEVKKLEKRKKFGIVWEDKPEDVAKRCKNELPVLEEDTEKEIKTDDKKPVNILIEGDNYHALSVLNYTHKGKIDVIYIDPPYNTGNRSWTYNNDYVEKEDSWKHSKWLSFMYKRLILAKNLLKQTGIIIITIDDYEIGPLRLLMDELFGEQNRLGLVTIMHNPRGRSDDKFFATSHEYALFYGKNSKLTKTYKLSLTDEQAEQFPFEDEISRYRLLPLKRTGSNSTPKERPNLYYPIYYNKSKNDIAFEVDNQSEEILPFDGDGGKRVWRWGKETLMERFKTDIVIKKNSKNKFSVFTKDRIKEGRKPKTVWVNPKYDASSHGTMLVQKLIGKRKAFDYPKSLFAVCDCLEIASKKKKNALILDFFAGSGTTGHAVFEINKRFGGDRKFILCTNNEDNNGGGNKIAEHICHPRVKKVIENLEKESKGKLISNRPSGLKYFKTDFVDAEPTDENKRKMVDKSTEMLCLKEDCFDEVKKDTDFKIFKNSQDKYLGIIFDDSGIEPFKKEVKKLNKQLVVYVFSLDESAREEEFEDMAEMVELRPIPAVILNVYKRIFK